MVVQHNLTAMNANRMLGITTGQQAKSSEKLSCLLVIYIGHFFRYFIEKRKKFLLTIKNYFFLSVNCGSI